MKRILVFASMDGFYRDDLFIDLIIQTGSFDKNSVNTIP
jgi:hypothetical protein